MPVARAVVRPLQPRRCAMRSVTAAFAALAIGVPALCFAESTRDEPRLAGEVREGQPRRRLADPVQPHHQGLPVRAERRARRRRQPRACRSSARERLRVRRTVRSRAARGRGLSRSCPAASTHRTGWMRDERGRVFQINFDLHRRLYFGVGYTPQKVLDNPLESTRTSIDFGLFIVEHLSPRQGADPPPHPRCSRARSTSSRTRRR